MKFSKLVVLVATLSQALGAHAAKVNWSSDSMKNVAKMHCAGQSQYKNETICQDYCRDTELSAGDKMCGEAASDAAAVAKAKADALAKAKKHDAEVAAAAEAAKAKADAQAAADAAAAAKALKETQKAAAAAKIAADQAEAKKKAEAEIIIAKTHNDEADGKLVGKVTVTSSKGYQGPTRKYDDAKSAEVFQQYCDWNGDLAQTPTADYTNEKVKRAAAVLTQINNDDFYFYGGIKRFYSAAAKTGPAEYSENARLFLTQLCGEFRDRPEMIEDKVIWITRMVRPGSNPQQPIDYQRLLDDKDKSKGGTGTLSIWSQMSGHTYKLYKNFSSSLFETRKAYKAGKAVKEKNLDKILGNEAEAPVKPNTICETKFIMGEYLAKGKTQAPRNREELSAYNKAYGAFSADPTKCDKEDKDYIYNFRGDANFKHYSPESNAMIWHALSIARFCKSTTESTHVDKDITDETCKNYFTAPFLSRYNAARSGLAAWILYDDKYMQTIQNAQVKTMVLPKFGKNVGALPFSLQLSSGDILDTDVKLTDSTLGFNHITGLDGSTTKDLKEAYSRLKGAVDRHTNWYQSGYNNIVDDPSVADKPDSKDQAYSPFVASSYEMSKSDAFAGCGYTVQCGPGIAPHKAWMFVFKVHKSNWYSTNSVADERPVDFDKVWLDETSLGIESLADAERAFDRLGTAIDGEYAEIIHLGNIESQSLEPMKEDPIK